MRERSQKLTELPSRAIAHLRMANLLSLAAKSGSLGIIWPFGESGLRPQQPSAVSWPNTAFQKAHPKRMKKAVERKKSLDTH